jgi:hypothetical protein
MFYCKILFISFNFISLLLKNILFEKNKLKYKLNFFILHKFYKNKLFKQNLIINFFTIIFILNYRKQFFILKDLIPLKIRF